MVDKVTVEIDSVWVKRINSPLYTIVAALTGVSVTFAPFFLYWSGWEMEWHGWLKWTIVALSFAVIYFVPLFYIRLSKQVIEQLRGRKLDT